MLGSSLFHLPGFLLLGIPLVDQYNGWFQSLNKVDGYFRVIPVARNPHLSNYPILRCKYTKGNSQHTIPSPGPLFLVNLKPPSQAKQFECKIWMILTWIWELSSLYQYTFLSLIISLTNQMIRFCLCFLWSRVQQYLMEYLSFFTLK